jgi:hypothetical protein
MSRLGGKLLTLLGGALLMVGINVPAAWPAPQKMISAEAVTSTTPLYLKMGANVTDSQKASEGPVVARHSSHASHASHESHYSHYSGR